MNNLIWTMLTLQAVMGFIDIIVHHEFLERLAWRSGAGQGFTHELCAAMENKAMNAPNGVIRLLNVRIGLVLSKDPGYLAQLLTPIDRFCGAILGRGKQWQSWVHRDDVVRAIAFCLARPRLDRALAQELG